MDLKNIKAIEDYEGNKYQQIPFNLPYGGKTVLIDGIKREKETGKFIFVPEALAAIEISLQEKDRIKFQCNAAEYVVFAKVLSDDTASILNELFEINPKEQEEKEEDCK